MYTITSDALSGRDKYHKENGLPRSWPHTYKILNQSGDCRNTTMFTISLTHVIFIDKIHTK